MSAQKIDVLLFDLELSGLESIIDLRMATTFFTGTKFLVYTNLPQEKYAVDIIRMGATGFIYKKLSAGEIEVLKHLNAGKRKKDIALLLYLDEKTISMYNLRLPGKLGVTKVVDLIAVAQSLQIL